MGPFPGRPRDSLPLTNILFAGPSAQDANLNALAQAQAMERSGADRNDIWNTTGWFNDGGNWSFESSPATPPAYTAPNMSGRKSVPLSSVSNDPAFARSYPGLADLPVITPNALMQSADYAAYYQPPSQSLPSGYIAVNPYDANGPKSPYYMQHEKQHAIDQTEGILGQGRNLPWHQQRIEQRAINGAYRDLTMTPEQRQAMPPWATEDEAFQAMHPQTYRNALAGR